LNEILDKNIKTLLIFVNIRSFELQQTTKAVNCTMKIENMGSSKRIIESLAGWATIGFFILWLLEIRRVAFKDSYWLIMLCLASLLLFQYLRSKRNAEPIMKNLKVPYNKPTIKPSLKKKKK
jgi:hypothetical protein